MLTCEDFRVLAESALHELDSCDVRTFREWLAEFTRNVRAARHDAAPGLLDDEPEDRLREALGADCVHDGSGAPAGRDA